VSSNESFLARVRQQMQGVEVDRMRGPAKERVRQNIVHNILDAKAWEEARATDSVDQLVIELLYGPMDESRPGYDNAPELLQDTFYDLLKADPRMVPRELVEPDARLNRRILKELRSAPHFEDLREMTATDETLSRMALEVIGEALKDMLGRNADVVQEVNNVKAGSGKPMNNPRNAPPPPDQQEDEEQGGNGPGNEEQDGEGGPSAPAEGDPDGDAEGQGDGDGEPGDVEAGDTEPPEDLDEQLEELLDELDLDRVMDKAARDALGDIEDLENIRKDFGYSDGEWKLTDPAKRLELAKTLRESPMLRAAAEMFGRMRRMALGARATRVVDVPHEAYDVKTGDEIRDVLGSELALLDDPDTELEFYRRMMDKELLVYAKRGTEDAGKGPVIVCIDKSASMSVRAMAPFIWAMGVAEALRRICQDEGRDYTGVFFGDTRRVPDDYYSKEPDLNTFEFPKGKASIEEILTFCAVQPDGGTDFRYPLEHAFGMVKNSADEGKKKADIVFISDGSAHLTEEWLEKFNADRAEIGCRVFGVFIGGASDYYYGGGTKVMEQFCDAVIAVSDLTPESVRDIFTAV
jgi:uncharacterized protein with von Willebrand factor type A (vWA) domain